jgi:hypothetical protein
MQNIPAQIPAVTEKCHKISATHLQHNGNDLLSRGSCRVP